MCPLFRITSISFSVEEFSVEDKTVNGRKVKGGAVRKAWDFIVDGESGQYKDALLIRLSETGMPSADPDMVNKIVKEEYGRALAEAISEASENLFENGKDGGFLMTNRGPAGIAAFLLLRKMGPEILDHPEFKDFKELNESILVDAAKKMQENVAKYEPPKPEVKIEKSDYELREQHKKDGGKFANRIRDIANSNKKRKNVVDEILQNRLEGSKMGSVFDEILSKNGFTAGVDEQGRGGIS